MPRLLYPPTYDDEPADERPPAGRAKALVSAERAQALAELNELWRRCRERLARLDRERLARAEASDEAD